MIQTLMERDAVSIAKANNVLECQGGSGPVVVPPAKTLHSYEQPVGIQVFQSQKISLGLFSSNITRGLVVLRQLSKDCRQTYRVVLASRAYQFSITLRITRVISFKSTLTAFSYRKSATHPGWNMSLSLAFSSIVPDHWPSFLAAKTGDVRTLKRLLIDGQAKISDITTRGDTLLHVCDPIKATAALN